MNESGATDDIRLAEIILGGPRCHFALATIIEPLGHLQESFATRIPVSTVSEAPEEICVICVICGYSISVFANPVHPRILIRVNSRPFAVDLLCVDLRLVFQFAVCICSELLYSEDQYP